MMSLGFQNIYMWLFGPTSLLNLGWAGSHPLSRTLNCPVYSWLLPLAFSRELFTECPTPAALL